MLETDSPYLAPVPYRGKRNESAYIENTMLRLAEVYGCSPAQVEEITNKTVKDIFLIPILR